eukprot:PITA_27569
MVKPGESCQVEGWAAKDDSGILTPSNFTRRNTGSHDVTFKVAYCGVCHSDLHRNQIRKEWKNAQYPMVPGHEIVGTVLEVGSEVKNFAVGDRVGVGCMVWSCQQCDSCSKEQEQFVVKIPENLPFDVAAPLLCAGITVYSPMQYFQMTEPGKSLGVVGLGGLEHMAVKFGKAFGLKVTVINTSPKKEKEAREYLGAVLPH